MMIFKVLFWSILSIYLFIGLFISITALKQNKFLNGVKKIKIFLEIIIFWFSFLHNAETKGNLKGLFKEGLHIDLKDL